LRDWALEAGYRCGLWASLRSPYLPLPRSYEAVEKALDGKFRQNLRRRKRRLAEQGEVKYALVDGKEAKALDSALADFFEIEASGWKGRDGTAIAQRPELVGFYTQIARDAAKRGALALGLLTLSGKPVAAHLSMVQGKRHYLIKIGYDESLHEHSPGQQMVSEAIRDSCARGSPNSTSSGPAWSGSWTGRAS
jgi:CelD/BcsL family acetyltransferase involved in cellulose biosynthesis